jgi:hypothetical protein
MSFELAAGPHHRIQSRIRVPWDSRPYITASDSRLPVSPSPTTRRVTMKVFDPSSARESLQSTSNPVKTVLRRLNRKHLV